MGGQQTEGRTCRSKGLVIEGTGLVHGDRNVGSEIGKRDR